MQPLFTIVTITYNSSQWVREAIESVLASSYTEFEYIIADDHSPDDTWSIVEQYSDERIRSWRNVQNIGEYANRNATLQEAKGKYILFVDGDDVLYRHTLRTLKEYIDHFPAAVSIWGCSIRDLSVFPLPQLLPPAEILSLIYFSTVPVAHIGLAETLFKTEALRSIGGFPNDLVSGDTYVKKRLAVEGDILLVPMGFVYWRQTTGQASASLQKDHKGMINNIRIDRKIIAEIRKKKIPVDVEQMEANTRIRDIKIYFKNILLKGKLGVAYKLFRNPGFAITDLAYLFKKGRYGYVDELARKKNISSFHFPGQGE